MRLSIMTLNLLHEAMRTAAGPWPARLPAAVALLQAHMPDVVCLQEASARQIDDLCGALGAYAVEPGPASGPGRRLPYGRDRDPGEHCAILLRRGAVRCVSSSAFWLSRAPDRPGSILPLTRLPRLAHRAVLAAVRGGPPFTLYNVHLDYLPWAKTWGALVLRRQADRDWDGTPQVVAGDLNAGPASAALSVLGRPPAFEDARARAPLRVGPEGTYHGGTGRVRWPGRLDYILVRGGLRAVRVATLDGPVGGVYPSDHFPVLAEIAADL